MSKTSKTIKRARRINLRMERIKKAVQATDVLLDTYFDMRASEIEDFNADLEKMTTTVDADKMADTEPPKKKAGNSGKTG